MRGGGGFFIKNKKRDEECGGLKGVGGDQMLPGSPCAGQFGPEAEIRRHNRKSLRYTNQYVRVKCDMHS